LRGVTRLFTVAAAAAVCLALGGGVRSAPASGCPRAALPLSDINPVAAATVAALRRLPRKERPQVRAAAFAVTDNARGPQVRTQCGQRVAERTIVVYVLRRAYLPAQSASQGVYFVSRFARGYRAWEVAH
jgi:hypothetical protein